MGYRTLPAASVESVLAFLILCLESGELGASDALRFAPRDEMLEALTVRHDRTSR